MSRLPPRQYWNHLLSIGRQQEIAAEDQRKPENDVDAGIELLSCTVEEAPFVLRTLNTCFEPEGWTAADCLCVLNVFGRAVALLQCVYTLDIGRLFARLIKRAIVAHNETREPHNTDPTGLLKVLEEVLLVCDAKLELRYSLALIMESICRIVPSMRLTNSGKHSLLKTPFRVKSSLDALTLECCSSSKHATSPLDSVHGLRRRCFDSPRNCSPFLRHLYDTDLKPLAENVQQWEVGLYFLVVNVCTTLQSLTGLENVRNLAQIELQGSCSNGFGLANSDIDVCIDLHPTAVRHINYIKLETETAAQTFLKTLDETVENSNQSPGSVMCKRIFSARVPILNISLINCEVVENEPVTCGMDICCGTPMGKYNSRLLRNYGMCDSRVQPLVVLVKHWAKQKRLCDPYRGSLSPYGYCLLVIFYLQQKGVVPNLQRSVTPLSPEHIVFRGVRYNVVFQRNKYDKEKYLDYGTNIPAVPKIIAYDGDLYDPMKVPIDWVSKNHECLEELFFGFFLFYAHQFNWCRDVVSIRRGPEVFPKVRYYPIAKQVILGMYWKNFQEEDSLHVDSRELDTEVADFDGRKIPSSLCIEDPFENFRLLSNKVKCHEMFIREAMRVVQHCYDAPANILQLIFSKAAEGYVEMPKSLALYPPKHGLLYKELIRE